LISSINSRDYQKERKKHPDIKVYGGVWPKYYKPVNNSNLKTDLLKGITNCDAIVVTGHRTGRETPLEKILQFREIIGNKELIIGAGLTKNNAREQLAIANGAIVGSYFKNGNTTSSLDEDRINEIMEIAKEYK
jgi:predicted TIM-barrel enzyme